MGYSKEERAHVRKNIYGFKVTDKEGSSFYIDFKNWIEKSDGITKDLESFYNKIVEMTYVEQFYESKEEGEKKWFKIIEYDESMWKNKK